VVRVRDSKGLHYLQALVRAGGQEIGALDLARAGGVPAGSTGGADAELSPDVGTGADEILDASARAAYRERLAELRIEEAEAEQWHDTERVARARGEIDFLEREVLAAVGLGGRARKLGGEAERARLSVTRAIRGAIKRVGALDPALGERLDAAVRTGTFCSFMVGRRTTTAMPRRP
jgi:hypothetical protein